MQRANEIRFDGWTLRLDSGELTRGDSTVRLQAQPLHVLQALLERPGEVVPREDLVARLWPSGIVDFETALNSAVRRLRLALDDIADSPRYIETIPRRGYRFVGAIDVPERAAIGGTAARIASAREPWLRSAVLGAAMLLAIASLGLGQDSGTQHGGDAELSARARIAAPSATRENGFAALRYREGRYFYERRAPGDLGRARKRFEEALALDPDSAKAHSGLASTYFLMAMNGEFDRDAAFARARDEAESAIAIDPRIAEAHYRRAQVARFTDDPRTADAEWHTAIALDPGGAMALSERATNALSEGRAEEGVELSRKASAAEPLATVYRYNLSVALFLAGRIHEAKDINLETLELSPGFDSDIAAEALILEGDFEPALALIQRWPDGPLRQECLALAYYGLHRIREADDSLASLILSAGTSDPLRIVEVYAYRGDMAAAFHWLDIGTALFRDTRAMARAHVWPWMLRLSPFAASLRGTPQWNAWLKTLAMPVAANP
ncbi:MAG TPA: winged helix-turn-helix domain-containing protein [Rhodanobacteraceae bacterium]|nr:winged helix-turn-helix domain-containing protein [Rhodanobacteraceae bacterium]